MAPRKKVDDDTVAALTKALESGQKQRSRDRLIEFQHRTRMTNFRPDGTPASRNGQPMMFGEGLGNNMLLDATKADTGWTDVVSEERQKVLDAAAEHEELVAKPARRRAGVEKAKKTRARNKARLQEIKAAVTDGSMLEGRRLFFLGWQKKDWDVRVVQLGGLPEGVDVARSAYGDVLAVPVIECAEGKAMKLTEGYRDREGRPFWVRHEIRIQVEHIFGRVMWKQALTVNEATEQFRVRLQ